MSEGSDEFGNDNTGESRSESRDDMFGLEDIEKAGLRTVECKFRPKDTIFVPGDPDDQLYFLISGVVRTYKIYGTCKEATTALVQSGDIFGNLDFVEGLRQSVFAEALTEARVASVQKTSISQVMRRHPEFALKLLSSFFERFRESEEIIESLLSREVSMRLATLLLNLADKFGIISERGVVLDIRLRHQDLASMIFSTREAVSKAMSDFQRDGYIETKRRKITLTDQAALASFAYSPA